MFKTYTVQKEDYLLQIALISRLEEFIHLKDVGANTEGLVRVM